MQDELGSVLALWTFGLGEVRAAQDRRIGRQFAVYKTLLPNAFFDSNRASRPNEIAASAM